MLGGVVRSAWIAALAGVVVLVSAACGGDDDEESTDRSAATTTSAPVTTTTLNDDAQKEEAAKAAYLAYWDAYMEATAEPVNPQFPAMQQLVTGAQQRVVTRDLENRQARGEAARLPPNSRLQHEVLSAELQGDGSVQITECEVNDAIVYDIASGAIINDDIVTKLATAEMVNEGGSWKIRDSTVVRRWPGEVECGE
jgi:hypothetical protein